MNNETILDAPHNFYHTWHNSLEWFLERPGKEGELCTRIADLLSPNGYDSVAIITTLNCAYRNCISVYQMNLPQYNYSTKVQQEASAFNSWGDSFTDQCITQILLAAQPEAKKSGGIRKLLARFDHNLYPDGFQPGDVSGLAMGLWNIKHGIEEMDIDFTPCPDMILVRSDIEAGKVNFTWLTNEYDHGRVKFLIGLMPTKEDKLYMLDRIDKAYHVWYQLLRSDIMRHVPMQPCEAEEENWDEFVGHIRFEAEHPDRELLALLANKEAEIECLKAQVTALRQQLERSQVDAPTPIHVLPMRVTHIFQINGGWNQILPNAKEIIQANTPVHRQK